MLTFYSEDVQTEFHKLPMDIQLIVDNLEFQLADLGLKPHIEFVGQADKLEIVVRISNELNLGARVSD